MLTTIRPITLTKLKKLDHNQLVKHVIDVMEQFDIKALRLQDAMEMLLQLRPQILKLEDSYGPHPLTPDIKKAIERRLELAGFIFSQMQLLIRVNMKKQQEAVRIARHPVRKYLLGIRKNNQEEISGNINQFLREAEETPQMQAAFTQLGFQDYIDELREVHKNYHDLYHKRASSIAQRPTKESKPIQKDCQAVLRSLFAQIELAQRMYKDQDYSLLIDSLNTVLATYTKSIKRRTTYNKKRAAAAAKAAAQTKPTTHILSVNGKETGSVTLGGKPTAKKKKTKHKTKKQAKKQTNNNNTKAPQPQKKENNAVNGLLDILKLPPGGEN